MKSSIQVTVAGQTFKSLAEAASHHGVSLQTAARRLREGWTPEQAFGLERRAHAKWGDERVKPLATSAGTFRTIQDAAAHFGIEHGTLTNRLRSGWPPDEAVGLVPHKRRPKTINVINCQGKQYPNADVFADAFGMNRIRVYKRLSRGWTPEQAVDLDPPPPRFRDDQGAARRTSWKAVEVVGTRAYPGADAGQFKVYVIRNSVNGKEYVGVTVSPLQERLRGHRAAARNGLKSKLYNAMRRYGVENFSIERVRCDARNFAELEEQETAEIARRGTLRSGYNTTPGGMLGSSEEITIAGVTYPSRGAAAEHFGIDVSVFNLRVSRLGWTPEQAAEVEPRPAFARRRVEVDGMKFRSLKSAAEHFELDYKVVHGRVTRDSWSYAQALELEPPPTRAPVVGQRLTAYGVEYPSISACARAHGLKPLSLRRRVVVEHEQVEQAIEALKSSTRLGLLKPKS